MGCRRQAYLHFSKNSTSYSRTPQIWVWKSAPEVGPERSGAADSVRLRAKYKFRSTTVQGGRCRAYVDPIPLT